MAMNFNPYKPFNKIFQIRWKEKLGYPHCPYLYRWTLILFGYSIRIHHWIKSDDRRYFHDHACDLISIILKGQYLNVMPERTIVAKAWRPRFMRAEQRHYLDIPKEGAWTLLLCGRPRQKWGFFVPRKNDGVVRKMSPFKYFKYYGIAQNENYQ
jgi:hypothetical protein